MIIQQLIITFEVLNWKVDKLDPFPGGISQSILNRETGNTFCSDKLIQLTSKWHFLGVKLGWTPLHLHKGPGLEM